MNNYVYIIASLPDLKADGTGVGDLKPREIIDEIRSLCNAADVNCIDTLVEGFAGTGLDSDFYNQMRKSRSPFLRTWFEYDRQVRNTKVEFLNRVLERDPGTDLVLLDGETSVAFEGKEDVESVLSLSDMIARERGLDNLMWDKVEDMVRDELFNLNVILASVAKLCIIDRWLKLDPETGRQMFRRLVQEIKKTSTI